MAGIGVKLNNIYGKRTLTTNIIGMGYSTVMTIAPMLTVIGALCIMEHFLGFDSVGYATRELFSCTVLYIFIFSLLTASPFISVLSKYMSDIIYEETFEDILPCYYVGMILNITFSALFGIPFCIHEYLVGNVDIIYVFTGYCGFVALVLVFYSMLYLSICKDYKKNSFFFMIGIVFVFYVNQTPSQPRERDYAYAGSFYAFAIWIGMGVAGLIHATQKLIMNNERMKAMPKEKQEALSFLNSLILSLICLFVPVQMASQTWDDHDRSDRYMARDFGQNYLMSLQESGNPIIYTNGDNDTFPLWYNQETEGFRTDARTCNLSYLQTDWYIDQMKRPAYDSPSLPITWDRMEYVEGTNEYVPIQPEYKKSIDQLYAEAEKQALDGNPEALVNVKKEFGDNPYELKNILKNWVRNKNQDLKVIPTDSIVIKVDKEAVRRSGMMIPGDSIPDYMHISLKGKRALYKSELMMLEMLSEANWERPIYIAVSVGRENQLNMENHFVQEGLAYRFTPFDTSKTGVTIDSEKMYDNLMNKFKFGGIDKPGIYIDENAMRMCHSHRRIFSQLVQQLMREGKKDKAKAALDYAEKMIPAYNVPYDWQNGAVQMAEAYYQLGETAKADEMMKALADKAVEYLTWYLSLDDNRFMISTREFEYHWAVLDAEVKAMKKYNSKLAEIYEPKVEELYNMYVDRMKE